MKTIALALAAGWCLAAHGTAAQETENRAALVRDLLSEDPDRVSSALDHLPLAWPPYDFREGFEVTTELVEALVAAYEREYVLGSPNGELFFALQKPVIATRHPLTVGILTRTLWGGNAATEGLLYFGPFVLPGVVDLAMSPEATPYEADGAMWALRKAVERWDGELGPEIREAMKGAAILHLEGAPDSFASAAEASSTMRDFLFDNAVALAKLLRDPELTAIARKARHPSTGRPGIPG